MIKQDIMRNAPKKGINVCGYDDDEDVGQRYYLIKNFADPDEAQKFAQQRAREEPDEEVVTIDPKGAVKSVSGKPVAPKPSAKPAAKEPPKAPSKPAKEEK